MADFTQLVSLLREQMNATLSRSDVLKPLAWLIALLVASLALSAWVRGPEWLLIADSVMLFCTVILYLGAYTFCLISNPDALRSEKYSLQKFALEHQLIGDSTAGLFRADEAVSPAKAIEGGTIKQTKDRS
ncbi:hypothetical protein EN852_014890 [Mesorhizobium sp. M2E.F.Ca.ET.209.01.1.1]|uniref:hypothetical protein n=1 Tax=Mesorhizobium sp. M2E.F.Ca.ET.209.01.1.1 TaxID=2500526 RepID=UPI000FD73698|nr:hypothetical protein [Mesorhizobium sp. M2E.F.Ca.ET.209.01.1.1]TGS13736.1 hypothetical protein EN852_014890 [Mesorhizobium sp. M2E.F.Ca.ET.209.01.1.1]